MLKKTVVLSVLNKRGFVAFEIKVTDEFGVEVETSAGCEIEEAAVIFREIADQLEKEK